MRRGGRCVVCWRARESQRQGDNNFIRSAGGPWRAEKSTWAKSRNKESLFLSLWERFALAVIAGNLIATL